VRRTARKQIDQTANGQNGSCSGTGQARAPIASMTARMRSPKAQHTRDARTRTEEEIKIDKKHSQLPPAAHRSKYGEMNV
jgi:hypothetical protein